MTEVIERMRRYALDGSDDDLRRLLGIAEVMAPPALEAFARVGVAQGWRALECGCGPLGSLGLLADAVGAPGRVVGVDFNPSTVERARAVVAALGLDTVEVLCADVNELASDSVGGPFDIAYMRCFLVHQAEPARTLRSIARTLRPGGWIVAQEPLDHPAPRAHPSIDALAEYWAVMCDAMARSGATAHAGADLHRQSRAAGLEVVATRGFFQFLDPRHALELHAATLAATRDRAVENGAATAERIDGIATRLRDAMQTPPEWVSSPFFVELTLRRPESDSPPP